jgi:hypothetical protein
MMKNLNRRHALGLLASTAIMAAIPTALMAATATKITVHKTPWCGCCTGWSAHLRRAGFDVTEIKHDDLTPIKQMMGVPAALESCHTAEVEGYAIEGHVPAADIKKLLATRPDAAGLAVPGMPTGSPGMEDGHNRDAYDVMLFGAKGMRVFNHYAAR